MSDTIKALEREIRKIEKRLAVLKKENPASERERKTHEATVALLANVLKDLRKQQKNVAQPKAGENAEAGQK